MSITQIIEDAEDRKMEQFVHAKFELIKLDIFISSFLSLLKYYEKKQIMSTIKQIG